MTNGCEKKFERFFGIPVDKCGQVLIISPFFGAKLFSAQLNRACDFKGMLFHGVSGMYEEKKVTFINTGMGQTFTADCVLAQNAQKIKAIIFLGAVGALQDLNISQGVLIQEAFFDSDFFSELGLLSRQDQALRFGPDPELSIISRRIASEQKYELEPARVISINTLWQQEPESARPFINRGMQAVDLECAFLYAAAARKKIKTAALCYVSDHLIEKPFWTDFPPTERSSLQNAMKKLAEIALKITARISE